MIWQLHEAKNRLSEVLEKARTEGPQTITRRGKEEGVLISVEEYRRLQKQKPSLLDYLEAIAKELPEDTFEHDQSPPREMEW